MESYFQDGLLKITGTRSKISSKRSEESCFLLLTSMPGSKVPSKTSEESYFLVLTSMSGSKIPPKTSEES